jgi:hypothetical protein
MAETFNCEGGCGRELTMYPRRKTRLCRRCCAVQIGRDPGKNEKVSATMKKLFADPAFRKHHTERCTEGLRAFIANNPEEMERRRASGKALAMTGLGHAAQKPGSAPRVSAGRKTTERRIGWCPPHLRDEYRRLKRKGKSAAEARAIIEAKMQRAREQRGQRLSFAEQLERAKAGGTLVKTFKPTAAAPDFTLGGVASGMI